MLEFLPKVDYTGVDIDQDYINQAMSNYGDKARFICSDISSLELNDIGTYDIVSAAGVLHHLNDKACIQLFEVAKKALKPGGKFVSMDGCYTKNQNKIARFFLDKDRGEFVRTQDEYTTLAEQVFVHVSSYIDESYFRIPYTSIIMECR